MSLDPTMAILYAQTGYTARVAHEAATAPQTSAAMARLMTEELMRQQQSQVQRMEKGDEARVAADGKQHSGQMPFGSRRRNRQPQKDDESSASDTMPDATLTPLLGNLLNLKV